MKQRSQSGQWDSSGTSGRRVSVLCDLSGLKEALELFVSSGLFHFGQHKEGYFILQYPETVKYRLGHDGTPLDEKFIISLVDKISILRVKICQWYVDPIYAT